MVARPGFRFPKIAGRPPPSKIFECKRRAGTSHPASHLAIHLVLTPPRLADLFD